MPVYCASEAPPADQSGVDNPDPVEAVLIVGIWMGGNPLGNPSVTEDLAREKLSFLLRTNFAGVDPELLEALKRIEPNTKLPSQPRGPRTDWERKAEIARFIHMRVGDFSRGNVTKAVEAAANKFRVEPEWVWKIWTAHRDDTWVAQPVTAARVPISAPPRRRRRRS
jgi:hypothetical protein